MDNAPELRTVKAWWTCDPCEATLSIEVTSNVEAFQPGGAAGELLKAVDITHAVVHGLSTCDPKSGRAEALRLL